MTQHLLIMGATSGIGKLAMEEALSRGHKVRAFARSADQLDDHPSLERFAGDALKPDDVAEALKGIDAVIYALGIQESLAMLWTPVTLFSNSTKILIDQMAQAGIRRLIVVTGFGAGRSIEAMSTIERMGHRAILGKPYEDKDRQEAMIIDSDTDWTIARPVILTKGAKTGAYRILRDPDTWRNGLISRADVAHYLIDAVETGTDLKTDVVLAR
ncbi:MAG: NAD(P)-binding oxidoreductase [Pseudomonadota bacterium]